MGWVGLWLLPRSVLAKVYIPTQNKNSTKQIKLLHISELLDAKEIVLFYLNKLQVQLLKERPRALIKSSHMTSCI